MRCKNCGADNDDNRYICEVCGSPLYDESDFDNANGIDDDRTQTFKAVNEPNNQVQNRNDNYNDYDKENQHNNQYNNQKNNESENKHKGAEKKSIIIIAVLAVILIAIIASVAAIAHNKNKDNTTSSNLTKISTQSDSTSDKYSTTEKKTTESTTESTTEKTTKQTTASLWIINTSSSGGGEAEGDGKYENGKKVTLVARADDGYKFDGWYSNGVKVSSKEEYTFTANQNASFSAQFSPVETQAPETTASNSGSDFVFGE